MMIINLIKAASIGLVSLGYFFSADRSVSVIFGLCAVRWCDHGVSVFIWVLSHPVLGAGAGRVCCPWLCLCLLAALLLLVLVHGHMLGVDQGAKRLKP